MTVEIKIGDCREVLRTMPDASVHCCVTSPPYFGLRDYGMADQIGLEKTPEAFIAELVTVFREVRRVLREDGTLWLNLGDSYASSGGHKSQGSSSQRQGRSNVAVQNAVKGFAGGGEVKTKDLIGIPWAAAFALRADGWYLRQDIIWHKPNPMPESVRDRCTKAHEYVFMLSKSDRYYYDAEAIKEDSVYAPGKTKEVEREKGYYGGKWSASTEDKQSGHGRRHAGFNDRWKKERNDGSFKAIREKRNKRSVWTIPPKPFKEAHFATFPPDLALPCILAGCPEGGTVLDPFGGAGTSGLVAKENNRNAVLIELNPEYASIAQQRIFGVQHAPWEPKFPWEAV